MWVADAINDRGNIFAVVNTLPGLCDAVSYVNTWVTDAINDGGNVFAVVNILARLCESHE